MDFSKNTLTKLALGIALANSTAVIAAPQNGSISSGSASISVDGLTINQGTDAADVVTIQWDSFDVAANETVEFQQHPNDVAINNIADNGNPSEILGSITGAGTIFLSNSNGFIFGSGSQINTGSFLATTSSISYDENGTIGDFSDDTINLSTFGSGSITVSSESSITSTADQEGYIAFISSDIQTSNPNAEGVDSTGSISNPDGSILFSNNTQGSLKLSGLDINFSLSESQLSGSSNLDNLNLSDLNIVGSTVILSGYELAVLTDNAISSPQTLTAEDLFIDSESSIGDVRRSIENAVETENNNTLINFEELTIQYRGAGDFSLNTTLNLLTNESKLNLIAANGIDLTNNNVFGTNLSLSLTANTVSLGNSSYGIFGSKNGLGSLNITANDGISLFGSIETLGDAVFNGPVYIDGDQVAPFIFSNFGSLTFSNNITGLNNSDRDLLLKAQSLEINNISNFNEIKLDASSIALKGDITSNTLLFPNASAITLFNNIALTASIIELDSASFNASDSSWGLSLIGNSADGSNRFTLKNIALASHDGSSSPLSYILFSGNSDAIDTNIFLGGTLDSSRFCIHSCTTSVSTDNIYNLSLTDNFTLTSSELVNIEPAITSGEYQFSVTGLSDSSEIHLGLIKNLGGLSLKNMGDVYLNKNIDTQELGLQIASENIHLSGQNDIVLTNTDSGIISIDGILTGNGSALSILSKNSDIYLNQINGVSSLTVENELFEEGSLTLGGDISAISNITLSNLGNIQSTASVSLNASDTISTQTSSLSTAGHALTFEASTLNIGKVVASSIFLYGETTNLFSDLTASNDVNFFKLDNSGFVINSNEIFLNSDVTITGDMDILDYLFSAEGVAHLPEISGSTNNLILNASNTEVVLSSFGTNSNLNSLTVSGEGTINMIELPNLTGIEGLSLLGNYVFDVGANRTFDTSSYNGNINFSGVDLLGSGALTFKTGTGELSLGNIGINAISDDQLFTDIAILSSGRLNLHGEIVTNDTNYEFSKLNSIQLEHDITLGTAEKPATINFGSASINGTYSLTLYSNDITLGTIGNNIALQDFTIISTGDISLKNDINMVGSANISANSLELDNNITTTGLNIDILTTGDLTMKENAQISAEFGDINLSSSEGNIGLGLITSGNTVTIRSELGYLFNAIDDYQSNTSTSINIQSRNQDLYGLVNVGSSVDNPIVINAMDGGTITAESGGTVYIANLANANIESSSRVIDSASGGDTASIDALTQLKLSSLNTVNIPTLTTTLGLISNLTWQVDEDESIRKIKTPPSTPSIYYSRKGWKLGY